MQYSGDVFLPTTCLPETAGRLTQDINGLAQAARERALVRDAQCGDLTAFNELVLTYQNIVFQQALWMLKEEEAAEDATQEVFIKAYRKIGSFEPGKSLRPWLLRIATNHCLDVIRAANRHRSVRVETPDLEEVNEVFGMSSPVDTPEQAYERAEVTQKISRAIEKLAPPYKAVVILVDLQGLDYIEVSAILGVPLGTMKSRLSRARRQLRDALQQAGMRRM